MIRIDFSLAVSLYLCVFLSVIIWPWVLLRRHKDKDLSINPRFIWHCSVCTYTYINTKQDEYTVCPRCGSYNKGEAQRASRESY